ncbi:MAG: extracellular solute-binding protein [Anaerolineae bacterium]|nr:extracellular solute-binding protein [Anaerolineae bacterium]
MKTRTVLFALVIVLVSVSIVVAQGPVSFFGTQFSPVEEGEKFRAILSEFGEVDYFNQLQEGELLDLVIAEAEAGQGTVDLVGILHGGFPSLVKADVLMDLTDLLEDLEADRDLADAFVELGLMGSEDYQYYIPWMQATYVMAAHKDALEYLPEGADLNALTWDQLAEWAKAIKDETGQARLGFPLGEGGLWHRFMEGYIYPSYTGGMVTGFKSEAAVEMFQFLKDLWPYVHEQSITYSQMQEPLLAGEVWVAFDHTARLINAFREQPDNFIAFPAPAGPAGRGFMPVVVGLGIPKSAPNPEGAMALIDYLTTPEVQAQVLRDLAFFPVVAGVDVEALPVEVAIEAAAVNAQATAPDALPALLPVGLGERGGEINGIYRAVFTRIVLDGEDIVTVLNEEAANLQALLNDTGAACWPPDPVSEGICQVE